MDEQNKHTPQAGAPQERGPENRMGHNGPQRGPQGGPQGGMQRGPQMPAGMQAPDMGYPVAYVPVLWPMPAASMPVARAGMGGLQGGMQRPQGGMQGGPMQRQEAQSADPTGECPKGKDLSVFPCPCHFPCQNGIRKIVREELARLAESSK